MRLLLITILCCIQVSRTKEQKEFDGKDARAELYQFYYVYLTKLESDSLHYMAFATDSVLRVYCTPELKRQLDDDLKSGKLDWDPFLNANDFSRGWLKTLQIKEDSPQGYFAVSYLSNSKEWVRMRIKMTLKQGKYLISEVKY